MDKLNINIDIMDKLTTICICKGISRAAIKREIQKGSKTVEDIKKTTGAGMGNCKGRRCIEKIKELLQQNISD